MPQAFEKNTTKEPHVDRLHALEGKVWFRFLKVAYVGLWVTGTGWAALSPLVASRGTSRGFWAFLIWLGVLWLILNIIKRSFYYVVLGRLKP